MIFKTIKKKITALLKDAQVGRNIEVLDSDIFLVSYPKSGNTWLRFLIGNVMYGDFNFTNMDIIIPDIYVQRNRVLKKTKTPRILKSHEYFDPRYSKIIYIVRDPRSVCISYFEYMKKMKRLDASYSLDDYVDLFVEGKFNPYGTWQENVESWVSTKFNNKDFLLVKYEDLKEDTPNTLKLILKFMEIEYNEELIQHAVEKSSFSSMKKNEKINKGEIKSLKDSNQNVPFVRKGETLEWKTRLSIENQNKIYNKFESTIKKLGYIK